MVSFQVGYLLAYMGVLLIDFIKKIYDDILISFNKSQSIF